MPHSFNRIWVHATWGTKERFPFIRPFVEKGIHNHMSDEFTELGCPLRCINGMPDHVHCLFLLNPKKAISDIIKQVKGSTAYLVNDQSLVKEKFSWQTGYAAYSVSESSLERVYLYILNQKQHHKKITFMQEYDELIKLHRVQNENG